LELEVGKNVHFPSDDTGKKFPCLVSRLNSDKVVPIIYFRGKSGDGQSAYIGKQVIGSLDTFDFSHLSDYWKDFGTAAAYADKGKLEMIEGKKKLDGGKWFAAETYQLIHPGLDGKFGKTLPNGAVLSLENLSQEDFDNITNFSDFKTIKSIMP
jgi:hypothetical protein